MDASLGWAWTSTQLSLNLSSVVSVGTLRSSGVGWSDSEQIRAAVRAKVALP